MLILRGRGTHSPGVSSGSWIASSAGEGRGFPASFVSWPVVIGLSWTMGFGVTAFGEIGVENLVVVEEGVVLISSGSFLAFKPKQRGLEAWAESPGGDWSTMVVGGGWGAGIENIIGEARAPIEELAFGDTQSPVSKSSSGGNIKPVPHGLI